MRHRHPFIGSMVSIWLLYLQVYNLMYAGVWVCGYKYFPVCFWDVLQKKGKFCELTVVFLM